MSRLMELVRLLREACRTIDEACDDVEEEIDKRKPPSRKDCEDEPKPPKQA